MEERTHLYLWLVGLPEEQCKRYATSDSYDSFVVAAPTAALARQCASVCEQHYSKEWLDEGKSFCLCLGETSAEQARAASAKREQDFWLCAHQIPEGCEVILGSYNGA